MATQVFTTWAALRDSMLDSLATLVTSGEIVAAEMRVGSDHTVRYRDLAEFTSLLDKVKMLAAQEEGTYSPRSYAKQGGRG